MMTPHNTIAFFFWFIFALLPFYLPFSFTLLFCPDAAFISRITDRRIMHRLTAEERARKIYKKSILRYKDVITLNKRMTCEDIRQEITETEVGNVEGISAIYEQIRYGAGEVDNHVIREMKAASGQNKRVNEKGK